MGKTPWEEIIWGDPDTEVSPEGDTATAVMEQTEPLYHVIVFNNTYNTFEEVIDILIRALSCSFEVAEHLTHQIHDKGCSTVATVNMDKGEKIANVIRSIKIRVSLERA